MLEPAAPEDTSKLLHQVTRSEPTSPSGESTITAIDDDQDEILESTLSLLPAEMTELADETQYVNDRIVNAAQELLRRRHKGIGGLCDTVAVAARDVMQAADVETSHTVQIFFDSDNKHWLCGTNKHSSNEHQSISLYCSLQMTPSAKCLATITHVFHMQGASLSIDIKNVAKQAGSIDCGLFAIAYAEMLCSDRDPCNVIFDQQLMRRHLIRCLEIQQITAFPVRSHRSVRRTVIRSQEVSQYCVCRSTYVKGEKMLECNTCHEWFHQRCLNMNDDVFMHFADTSATYSCSRCRVEPAEQLSQPDMEVRLMTLVSRVSTLRLAVTVNSIDRLT